MGRCKVNIDCLVVRNHSKVRTTLRVFDVNMEFFKDPVIMKITEKTVEFKKATLDYRGKVLNFQTRRHKNSGSYYNSMSVDIPPGKYPLNEEESDEDHLVFDII